MAYLERSRGNDFTQVWPLTRIPLRKSVSMTGRILIGDCPHRPFDNRGDLRKVRPSSEKAAAIQEVNLKSHFPMGYWVRGQKPLAQFFGRRKDIMAYRVKTYTLREEAAKNGTRYFISFKDGQGGNHELEVSEQFFIEFRQMERKNRNLLQSDERHKEFFELSDEALNRRARVTPKGVDELIIEQERSELLYRTIAALPEIHMLVLVGAVKMSDRIIREMMGL